MANIGQITFTASGHGRRRGRGEKIHGVKLTSSSGKDDHVRHVAGGTCTGGILPHDLAAFPTSALNSSLCGPSSKGKWRGLESGVADTTMNHQRMNYQEKN